MDVIAKFVHHAGKRCTNVIACIVQNVGNQYLFVPVILILIRIQARVEEVGAEQLQGKKKGTRKM